MSGKKNKKGKKKVRKVVPVVDGQDHESKEAGDEAAIEIVPFQEYESDDQSDHHANNHESQSLLGDGDSQKNYNTGDEDSDGEYEDPAYPKSTFSYVKSLRDDLRAVMNYPWKIYKRGAILTEGSVGIEPFYSTFLVVTSIELDFEYLNRLGGGTLVVLAKLTSGAILVYAGIGNLKGDVGCVNFCEEADEFARGTPNELDHELDRIKASPLRRFVTKALAQTIIIGSNVVYINGAMIDVIPVTWLFPEEFGLVRWLPITAAMLTMVPFGMTYYNMFCNGPIRKFVLRTVDVLMRERLETPSYQSDVKQVLATTGYGVVNMVANTGYVLTDAMLTLPTALAAVVEIGCTSTYRGGVFAFAIKANLTNIFKEEDLNVIAGFMKLEFGAAFVNATFSRGYATIEKYYGKDDALNLIRAATDQQGSYVGKYKMLADTQEKSLWWPQYVVYKLRVSGANLELARTHGSLTKKQETYAAFVAATRSVPLFLLLAAYDVSPWTYTSIAIAAALHAYYASMINDLFRSAADSIKKTTLPRNEYENIPERDEEAGMAKSSSQPSRTTEEQKLYDALNLSSTASSSQQFDAIQEICNQTAGLEEDIKWNAFLGRVVRFVGYLNFFVSVDAILAHDNRYAEWDLKRPEFIELVYIGVMTSFLTLGNEFSQFVSNMKEVVPYQMAKLRVAKAVFGTLPEPEAPANQSYFAGLKKRATDTWESLTWTNIKTFFTPKATLPPEKVRAAYEQAKKEHSNPLPAQPGLLASCSSCIFGTAGRKDRGASTAQPSSRKSKRC